MIINHNISALNTHRQLNANNNAVSNSLEKLSSGLKINRAGDDAAGLAISEKMRGQIKGLEMASKNAQDGISLIQTAEGALNETHAILQRMRELAVQSSNDTNNEADRGELQKEIDQLAQALNDISNDTEFNTKKLLNGEFSGTFHVGANEGQNLSISIDNMSATNLKAGFVETVEGTESSELGNLEEGETYAVVGFKAQDVGNAEDETNGEVIEGAKYALQNSDGEFVAVSADGEKYTNLVSAVSDLKDATIATDAKTIEFENAVKNGTVSVGTEYDSSNNKVVDITATGGIYIGSQEDADSAITTIQSAIDTVSAERSKLGAVQNRLEHTINNLGASAENLTAAESRIRDVDMAKEMMEFTKNNILTQAAQAMLAQANQTPQGVLQLLR